LAPHHFCSFTNFLSKKPLAAYESLKKALERKEIATEVAEISMVPQNTIPVNDEPAAEKILELMEMFEDHDDVQNVHSNFDIPDEIVERIS